MLSRVNWLLDIWHQPPLSRLGQLYGEVDECFLTTFREFEPNPASRPVAHYWGPVPGTGGKVAEWPNDAKRGHKKRVFAYLKYFPGIAELFRALDRLGLSTLVYPDGIAPKLQKRFESSALRFATQRIDPATAAASCDLAVLNGTHGTTCDMLLAGKPILQIPIYGDQELVAEATARMGAAEVMWPKRLPRDAVESLLERLISDDRYTVAAKAFAREHAWFTPDGQREQMTKRAMELLPDEQCSDLSHWHM
jgi:hypothetical protein